MPINSGLPIWTGAPCTAGKRVVIWMARIASAGVSGRMETTMGPWNGPAGMVARRRGRPQRTGLGVELAKAEKIAREPARQDGQVSLHVARRNTGRLAVDLAAAGGKARIAAGPGDQRRSTRRSENRHALPFL